MGLSSCLLRNTAFLYPSLPVLPGATPGHSPLTGLKVTCGCPLSMPNISSCHSRLFSVGECSVERMKLCSSPTPIDSTTCPTCGPYHIQPAPSSSSSQSSGGYIRGVSPSPSELALPNAAFSTQQLDQVDVFTFEVYSLLIDLIRETLCAIHVASIPVSPVW